MTRIFLVGQPSAIRAGLAHIVESQPEMGVCGAGLPDGETVQRLAEQGAELVILEVDPAAGDGIGMIKRLRLTGRKLPVVVVAHPADPTVAVRCLKAGASGFLTRDGASLHLIPALQAVLAGRRYLCPELGETVVTRLAAGIEPLPHERLSDREYFVLCRIAQGLTAARIARELELSTSSINHCCRRILAKLALPHKTDLVRYALEHRLVE